MQPEIRVYDAPNEDLEDDLLPEYHFDYSKAKPNPYAAHAMRRKTIILDADIGELFTSSEPGNKP